ncbi:hypothetical protein BXY_31930 [Bacteroides xylanisolvens XB1A]|uniref:Uncharacterized protein n=1 Tax=Bacteroides xylanisolvens XB1A TaxID=657309 RepID=D6D198_9BACE|nr:hypothetical protein BXY_31930 [Bacteroides xylanisolvens XB1A]
MWELSFLYVETSVSSRGNCSSYAWKLNLPVCKTGLYKVLQINICNGICNSICNAAIS